MNSHRNRCRQAFPIALLILTLFLPTGCGPSPQQAEVPRMNRLDLMSAADLIVHCSDTANFATALERSPLGQLWNSPEMTASRADHSLEVLVQEALTDADDGEHAERINEIYMSQIKMLDGEFILGMTFNDLAGEPEITLVAAISEADFNRSLEMDALLHELESKETVAASEVFRDTRIYTYLEKKEDGDRYSYQAFYEGTLVASDNRLWLEQALIQLMETPAREPQGDPVLTLSGKAQLLDRLQARIAAKAAMGESPLDWTALVKSLGLDTLGDMRMQVQMQADRAEITLAVDRRGEWNRGLMVLVPPEPVPVDFRLAYVPPDVASYQVTRLDLNAFWMQLPGIMQQISPEVQMQFSLGVNAVGGMMGININEDVFQNLDSLNFSYTRFGDQGQEILYGLNVRDTDAMERTLQKLFAANSPLTAQISPFYRETDIQGQTIHLMQFPVAEGGNEENAYQEVGITVVDRALVIGSGNLLVDYVQAAVNRQGPSTFYESRPFREMAARVPAGACTYGISDMSAYVRYFAAEIHKTMARAQAGQASPANVEEDCGCEEESSPLADFWEDFDLDSLPSAEVMARYFGTSEGYSVIDANGFRSTLTIHYPQL
ncbi:MAG: hypothetical protein QNJ02_05580 [Desulfobacterales bacterium]|nr:hypothetical protein [Desulfobacterales bacterium]